jgi:hypothetical protein
MVFASTSTVVLTVRTGFLSSGKTGRLSPRKPGMSTFQTMHPSPCRGDGPPASVVDWRRCRLIEAGFPVPLATVLAHSRDVDVHALLQLVDRGCPPELAARILAPLGAPA